MVATNSGTQEGTTAKTDGMIPNPSLNQPCRNQTTSAVIVDQFILNKMAQAVLPMLCVVRCWERQDQLKGRLMLLHRCRTGMVYNLGDVISRDPQTGKATGWRYISSA